MAGSLSSVCTPLVRAVESIRHDCLPHHPVFAFFSYCHARRYYKANARQRHNEVEGLEERTGFGSLGAESHLLEKRYRQAVLSVPVRYRVILKSPFRQHGAQAGDKFLSTSIYPLFGPLHSAVFRMVILRMTIE